MNSYRSDLVETRYVDGSDCRYAYRRLGTATGIPLLMCSRFRGTIDHWDPALLDPLAAQRDIIIFDNRGTNLSTGVAPDTVEGLAAGAIEFVERLGIDRLDVLGWSMGGYVAQSVAASRPNLVRRLIVAGSGPGGVPNTPKVPDKVWQVATRPVNDDEDFLYLFFPETKTARQAGIASLRRLDQRLAQSHASVSAEATQAQLLAVRSFSGFYDQLAGISIPVLVADGAHDVVNDVYGSYAMVLRLPSAKLIVYSDAGHAFLFQHADDFSREILDFLR